MQISNHAGGISAAARAGKQPSGDTSRLPGHGSAGTFPRDLNHRASGVFAGSGSRGGAGCPARAVGRGRTPRGVSAPRAVCLSPRGTFLVPVFCPDCCFLPLPVSGVQEGFAGECSAPVWSAGIPQSMPRLFPPPFPPFPFRTFGSGHGLRFPPFRRGVSHAGREGRLDGHRAKTGSLNRRICVDRQIESLSAKAPSVTAPPSGTVQGRGGNGCFTAWSGFCFSSLAPDLKFLSLL